MRSLEYVIQKLLLQKFKEIIYEKTSRLERGLSQEQLAEKVGLGSKSINPIENGYDFIAIEKLPKFCEALRVPAFSLFVCESDMEKDLLLKRQALKIRK